MPEVLDAERAMVALAEMVAGDMTEGDEITIKPMAGGIVYVEYCREDDTGVQWESWEGPRERWAAALRSQK